MKRVSLSMLVVLLGIAIAGCGAASKAIAVKSQGERSDVFRELAAGESAPEGHAIVLIRAGIKTHLDGYYIVESNDSPHGKSTYPFIVNIDGQVMRWSAEGKLHQLPQYVDGKTSRDPEAGEGMKYVLEKNILLAAGAHKVFLGLSAEPCYAVADITVRDGKAYVLEFKPVYRYKTIPVRIETFYRGISRYDAQFSAAGI